MPGTSSPRTALSSRTSGTYPHLPDCAPAHAPTPDYRRMLHDPETYADPMSFNPDRFLAAPGKEPETDPRGMVFGFGRRYVFDVPPARLPSSLTDACSLSQHLPRPPARGLVRLFSGRDVARGIQDREAGRERRGRRALDRVHRRHGQVCPPFPRPDSVAARSPSSRPPVAPATRPPTSARSSPGPQRPRRSCTRSSSTRTTKIVFLRPFPPISPS